MKISKAKAFEQWTQNGTCYTSGFSHKTVFYIDLHFRAHPMYILIILVISFLSAAVSNSEDSILIILSYLKDNLEANANRSYVLRRHKSLWSSKKNTRQNFFFYHHRFAYRGDSCGKALNTAWLAHGTGPCGPRHRSMWTHWSSQDLPQGKGTYVFLPWGDLQTVKSHTHRIQHTALLHQREGISIGFGCQLTAVYTDQQKLSGFQAGVLPRATLKLQVLL